MQPLVSVILPCYNADQYLEQALHSIINQTYKNLEILLIDDGSTDKSPSIYENIKQREPRLKVYKNENNIGLIKTLNRAITLSTGDYIARMDADDISAPRRIEKQVSFLIKNPTISIVGTGAIPIDLEGNQQVAKEEIYTEPETIRFSALFTQPLFHGSVLAKSAVLKNNAYSLEYKHSEDFELWLRAIFNGKKITNLPETLYSYRNNPEGVSNNNTLLQEKSHNKASKKYLEELLQEEVSIQIIAILNNRPVEKVNLKDFKKSIRLLNRIIQLANRSRETRTYFTRQRINIAIQSLKKARQIITFLYISCFLVYYSGFNKIGFVYLLNKLKQ